MSTYVELKRRMSDALLRDFDGQLPVRDIIRNAWLGSFRYISKNLEYYDYME